MGSAASLSEANSLSEDFVSLPRPGKDYIYVLLLGGDNYYVGKTVDVNKRVEEHRSGGRRCADWVGFHGFVRLETSYLSTSEFDEEKTTKEMMKAYGPGRVRGAKYVQRELSELQLYDIYTSIYSTTDNCQRCGRSGHRAIGCCEKSTLNGHSLVKLAVVKICKRCDGTGHSRSNCIATCKVDGKPFDMCDRCQREGHVSSSCTKKTTKSGKRIKQ